VILQEMKGPDFLNVHWRLKHEDFNDIRVEGNENDVEFLETFVFMIFQELKISKQSSYMKSRIVGGSAFGIDMTQVGN